MGLLEINNKKGLVSFTVYVYSSLQSGNTWDKSLIYHLSLRFPPRVKGHSAKPCALSR
jgi:hypothetical protein